ncbi:MAG TPA: hypothetical protein VM286_07555 [Candidatus Thermoplasmatota archaeon]|nr:hypothetical protein [Candidatus Thermoplasmatota archaeon]
MGVVGNLQTSLRLTLASFRLIFRKPVVLTLPLLTLLWTGIWVVGPLEFFIWLEKNSPDASHGFWKGVFFVSVAAFQSGDYGLMVSSAIVTVYVIWAAWMTIALTGALFFVTVGMDVATQQIRTRTASLGQAFTLARRNLGRIFLVALTIATIIAWVKYATTFVLRLVPFVGRWVNRVLRAALSAVTYLMLPIVVYERAGPIAAARSAWTNVRKTWSGLLVGTGLIYFAGWLLLNVLSWALFQGVLGLDGWGNLVPSILLAGLFYAVASSTAAAMRATLYWYATTGEVPEGFDRGDLPQVASHAPFTALAAAGLVAVPTAPSPPPVPAATGATPPGTEATPRPNGPALQPPSPSNAPAPQAMPRRVTPSKPASGGATPNAARAARPAARQPAAAAKVGRATGGASAKAATVGARQKLVAESRLVCPKCKTVAVVPAGTRPACAACGYGKGAA